MTVEKRMFSFPRKALWSKNLTLFNKVFPSGSDGKESTCNVEDLGSIPGSGRSSGEGYGYPLQYSWASLVAQLVKNLLAVWETWVQLTQMPSPILPKQHQHISSFSRRSPPSNVHNTEHLISSFWRAEPCLAHHFMLEQNEGLTFFFLLTPTLWIFHPESFCSN